MVDDFCYFWLTGPCSVEQRGRFRFVEHSVVTQAPPGSLRRSPAGENRLQFNGFRCRHSRRHGPRQGRCSLWLGVHQPIQTHPGVHGEAGEKRQGGAFVWQDLLLLLGKRLAQENSHQVPAVHSFTGKKYPFLFDYTHPHTAVRSVMWLMSVVFFVCLFSVLQHIRNRAPESGWPHPDLNSCVWSEVAPPHASPQRNHTQVPERERWVNKWS